VPPDAVTITSATPGVSVAGETAVIENAEFTVTVVADTPPKVTVEPVVKLVPAMTTEEPPPVGPELGVNDVTVGDAVAEKVNRSLADVAEVPPGVATVMSTVLAPAAGETAVIDVAELTVKLAAGVAPKLTAVVPVKFVPVIATGVPPAVGPDIGFTAVMVGAAK